MRSLALQAAKRQAFNLETSSTVILRRLQRAQIVVSVGALKNNQCKSKR